MTQAPGPAARGRVLCVTSTFPRWTEDSTTTFVLFLASDLQSLGWQVDVLAPHAPGARFEEVIEGVHVERFRYAWPPQAETLCYGGGALVNLREDPGNVGKIPLLVGAQLAGVLRRLASKRYDVLHTHWTLPQGFTGALASKASGVPHVLTVHGEEFTVLRSAVAAPFKRFALRAADAVTANSSATERQALAAAGEVADLRRIPMGVDSSMEADPEVVAQVRARYRTGDGPLIFSVGRLVEEKGFEDLIRAVEILARSHPDVHCVVSGAGRDEDRLRRIVKTTGTEKHVTMAGFVHGDQLASYYAAADVFVAPSRTGPDGWVEGQGITPLEAMVMATPVVATTLGGYADTILHERTALAVPERSPEAIAAAVDRVLREPDLVRRMTTEARRFAIDRYARSSSARAFSELFAELVAKRGA